MAGMGARPRVSLQTPPVEYRSQGQQTSCCSCQGKQHPWIKAASSCIGGHSRQPVSCQVACQSNDQSLSARKRKSLAQIPCEPILIISHPPRKFLRRSRTSITFRIRSFLISLAWPKCLVRLEVVSCRRKLGKICKRLGGQLENFVIRLRDVYQSYPGTWLTVSANGHMTD